MLVISRKIDETITIGDNIKIIITRIKGKNVRVGIEAPKDIEVRRDDKPYKKPELPFTSTSSDGVS